MKRLLIVLPVALLLCSCSSATKRHRGEWKAINVGEDTYVVKFLRGRKAEVTTPKGTFPGEYAIDYSKKPIRLDVTWDEITMKCILEFRDKETFRIIGESDPGKLRPLGFEPPENVVIFKKVEENKKKKK